MNKSRKGEIETILSGIFTLFLITTFMILSIPSCVHINSWRGTKVETVNGRGTVVDTNWHYFTKNTLEVRLDKDIINAKRIYLEKEVKVIENK